ncbi:hypothetical protein BS17DRAFT_791531 [Gyrodon lividus]|nr:hypothetical protein BS17DRAFT_791531 [Gyrodon lividus]
MQVHILKSLEDIKLLKYVGRIRVSGFRNKVRDELEWHQNGGIMTEGNGAIIVKQGERELLIGTADTYVKR